MPRRAERVRKRAGGLKAPPKGTGWANIHSARSSYIDAPEGQRSRYRWLRRLGSLEATWMAGETGSMTRAWMWAGWRSSCSLAPPATSYTPIRKPPKGPPPKYAPTLEPSKEREASRTARLALPMETSGVLKSAVSKT